MITLEQLKQCPQITITREEKTLVVFEFSICVFNDSNKNVEVRLEARIPLIRDHLALKKEIQIITLGQEALEVPRLWKNSFEESLEGYLLAQQRASKIRAPKKAVLSRDYGRINTLLREAADAFRKVEDLSLIHI